MKKQTVSFQFDTVPAHSRPLRPTDAAAGVLLLAVYIVIVMRRSSESVEREAERSHLHTKELPKNMLPLLV